MRLPPSASSTSGARPRRRRREGRAGVSGLARRARERDGASSPLLLAGAVILFVALLGTGAAACGGELAEAQQLEQAGEWEAALSVYQQVLAEDPENVAALSGAAVALMVLQRFDEALRFQERVAAVDPEDVQTRLELGFNYLNHQDRPGDAVRVLEEATELDPTAKNLTFLAQALEQAGDAEGAEQALTRAIEVDPLYQYAYSRLARLLESQGRGVEAQALWVQAANAGVTVDGQR